MTAGGEIRCPIMLETGGAAGTPARPEFLIYSTSCYLSPDRPTKMKKKKAMPPIMMAITQLVIGRFTGFNSSEWLVLRSNTISGF